MTPLQGLIPKCSLTLASYLRLLRTTAQLCRPGKRRLSKTATNTTTPITRDLTIGARQIFERFDKIAEWVDSRSVMTKPS